MGIFPDLHTPDLIKREENLATFFAELAKLEQHIIFSAVEDIGMTRHYARQELAIALAGGRRIVECEKDRVDSGGSTQIFGVNLPYNSTLIALLSSVTNAYLSGKAVVIRISSKLGTLGTLLAETTANILEGVWIFQGSSEHFFAEAFRNEHVCIVQHYGAYRRDLLARLVADGKRTRKTIVFEGPGNNPLIVASRQVRVHIGNGELQEKHLVDIVEELCLAAFSNSGQICLAPKNIYVTKNLAGQFRECLVAKIQEYDTKWTGDPYDPEVIIGPVGDERIATHPDFGLEALARQAIASGEAAPLYASEQGIVHRSRVTNPLTGQETSRVMVRPTLVEIAEPKSKIQTSEKFGPVLTLRVVENLGAAVQSCADPRYGLIATVYAGDDQIEWARKELSRSHGHVMINETFLSGYDIAGPWGGYGWSALTAVPVNIGPFHHYAVYDGPRDFGRLVGRPSFSDGLRNVRMALARNRFLDDLASEPV